MHFCFNTLFLTDVETSCRLNAVASIGVNNGQACRGRVSDTDATPFVLSQPPQRTQSERHKEKPNQVALQTTIGSATAAVRGRPLETVTADRRITLAVAIAQSPVRTAATTEHSRPVLQMSPVVTELNRALKSSSSPSRSAEPRLPPPPPPVKRNEMKMFNETIDRQFVPTSPIAQLQWTSPSTDSPTYLTVLPQNDIEAEHCQNSSVLSQDVAHGKPDAKSKLNVSPKPVVTRKPLEKPPSTITNSCPVLNFPKFRRESESECNQDCRQAYCTAPKDRNNNVGSNCKKPTSNSNGTSSCSQLHVQINPVTKSGKAMSNGGCHSPPTASGISSGCHLPSATSAGSALGSRYLTLTLAKDELEGLIEQETSQRMFSESFKVGLTIRISVTN